MPAEAPAVEAPVFAGESSVPVTETKPTSSCTSASYALASSRVRRVRIRTLVEGTRNIVDNPRWISSGRE